MSDIRYAPTTPEGRIALFVETVGEALRFVGKIGRFGPFAQDPNTGIQYQNASDLLKKTQDVETATVALRKDLVDAVLEYDRQRGFKFGKSKEPALGAHSPQVSDRHPSSFSHVMVDLETMGVAAGCQVVSLGAVMFDPTTGVTGPTGYWVFNRMDYMGTPFATHPGTVEWWQKQSEEARGAYNVFCNNEGQALGGVLDEFTEFFQQALRTDRKIWGNGADFDIPILGALYLGTGRQVPWKPYMGRCYRTLKSMVPEIKLVRTKDAHTADGDAYDQAVHAMKIMRATGYLDI